MTLPDLYFEMLTVTVACLINSIRAKVEARKAIETKCNSPCGKLWIWRSNKQDMRGKNYRLLQPFRLELQSK